MAQETDTGLQQHLDMAFSYLIGVFGFLEVRRIKGSKMITIVTVFMLLNGQPVGNTVNILAAQPGCATELAAIRGINQVMAERGIEFVAACETRKH